MAEIKMKTRYSSREHRLLSSTMDRAWEMLYMVYAHPERFQDFDKEKLAEWFQENMSIPKDFHVVSLGSSYTYIKYCDSELAYSVPKARQD